MCASDVSEAVEACVPQATKNATDFWVRVFTSFCREKDIHVDLKTSSPKEINDILCSFYLGLRTKDGGVYKRNSYLAARSSLGRYMCQTLDRPECNIWKSSAFERSHRVLDGLLKQRKDMGEELSVQHKDAVSKDDLERIDGYFSDVLDVGDPIKLTQYCWYHITMHFSLRASEVQTKLKKSDLVFDSESFTGEFVSLGKDFMSKNCPGGVKGREFETCGRITNQKQVAAIRKLIDKSCPTIDRLFQRAKTGRRREDEEVWYMRAPDRKSVV